MKNDEISPLVEALNNASSLDEIWLVINRADASFQDGAATNLMEASFAAQISAHAVRIGEKGDVHLRDFVDWNAKMAMCAPASGEPHVRIQIQQSRGYIGDFIRGLRWPLRLDLSERVLSLASAKLCTDQHKPACWLINSVGWRSQEIASTLWNVTTELDDDRGDVAFGVLVELGVPKSRRSLYLKEAHRRFERQRSRPNMFAIGHLASSTSLRFLTFPKSWNNSEEEQDNVTFIPSTVAMIADRSRGKAIANQSVELLKSLFYSNREKMVPSIYLAGNVVPSCDSEEATAFLMDLLAEDGDRPEPPTHGIFLLLHRLEQCVRPNQILGFGTRRDSTKLKKLIERVVTGGNEYKGSALTYDGDIKDRLWNLCLMIGSSDWQRLALKILEEDQSPYAQFKVLEDLACFSLRPMPKQIAKWIEAVDVPNDYDDAEQGAQAILRSAALRIAWSSGSEEGFQLLLDSRYTHRGMTMADSADGLAHLSVLLAKDALKRREIIDKIFAKFETNPSPPTSGMVCAAIYALAHSGFLAKQDYKKLCSALLDEPPWMVSYDKSRIISAIGTGPSDLIVERLRSKLIDFTITGDERLATASFEALIDAGLFQELPVDSLSRLGLSWAEGTWAYTTPTGKYKPNGGLFVMLLKRDYDLFAQAFASFLETSPFRSFVQGLEALNRAHRRKTIPFAPTFTDALLNRAESRNTLFDAEPYIFRWLATHDYITFASRRWSTKMAEWPAASREALGSAFVIASPRSIQDLPAEGISTLVALHSDPNFAVRRAAFRALGVLVPSLLSTMARNLAFAEIPAQRVLAAEAIYWIPAKHRDEHWWKLIRRLSNDVAEDVRDATKEAGNRARKLEWSRLYVSRLLAPVNKEDSNQDVLDRWKFSEGLVRVGDDQTAHRIRGHLQKVRLPANYQRFLIKTTETLEKNWDKFRSKWPEPMFTGNASISTGKGELVVEAETWPVSYVVWRNIDVADPSTLVFGGTVALSERTKRTDLIGMAFRLILSDKTEAKVWINRVENQIRLSFGGQESVNVD